MKILCSFEATLTIVAQSPEQAISERATFYVINHGRQNLLGRETSMKMGVLNIGIPDQFVGNVESQVHVSKFPAIKGVKIHIETDPTITPIAMGARPVPMRFKRKVEEEEVSLNQAPGCHL